MQKIVSVYFTFKNLLLQNCYTSIISELIAENNLDIANLMQTFENLLFRYYSTQSLDIAHK